MALTFLLLRKTSTYWTKSYKIYFGISIYLLFYLTPTYNFRDIINVQHWHMNSNNY